MTRHQSTTDFCYLQAASWAKAREGPQQTGRHPREAQAIDHILRAHIAAKSRKKPLAYDHWLVAACKQSPDRGFHGSKSGTGTNGFNSNDSLCGSLGSRRLLPCRSHARRRDPLPASVQRARMGTRVNNSRRLMLASLACRTRAA